MFTPKDPAAVEAGRKRWRGISPERRRVAASAAARSRWATVPKAERAAELRRVSQARGKWPRKRAAAKIARAVGPTNVGKSVLSGLRVTAPASNKSSSLRAPEERRVGVVTRRESRSRRPRDYHCPTHRANCPAWCGYLKTMTQRWNALARDRRPEDPAQTERR